MAGVEITVGGFNCVEPGPLKQQIDEYNARNPASALPTEKWWGVANSYTNTIGPEPSVGYFLLLRADLDKLDLKKYQIIELKDGEKSVKFKLKVDTAEKVTGGPDNDPNSVYFLTAYDERQDARESSIDKSYNIWPPCGQELDAVIRSSGFELSLIHI